MFDEFSHWAITRHLHLDNDVNDLDISKINKKAHGGTSPRVQRLVDIYAGASKPAFNATQSTLSSGKPSGALGVNSQQLSQTFGGNRPRMGGLHVNEILKPSVRPDALAKRSIDNPRYSPGSDFYSNSVISKPSHVMQKVGQMKISGGFKHSGGYSP